MLAVLDDGSLPAGITARRTVGCHGATVVPGFGDAREESGYSVDAMADRIAEAIAAASREAEVATKRTLPAGTP